MAEAVQIRVMLAALATWVACGPVFAGAAEAPGKPPGEGVEFNGYTTFACVEDVGRLEWSPLTVAAWVKVRDARGEQVFLGRELSRQKDYSEKTAVLIDDEVRSVVTKGYQHAKEVLKKNIDALHSVAKALRDKESLSGEEVTSLVRGEGIENPSGLAPEPSPAV